MWNIKLKDSIESLRAQAISVHASRGHPTEESLPTRLLEPVIDSMSCWLVGHRSQRAFQ